MTSDTPRTGARDAGHGGLALLIIDMMNDFAVREGRRLRQHAEAISHPIVALRAQVEDLGGAIIYVNDNFGEWHSERQKIVDRALKAGSPTRLAPRQRDYFILKPQFSGFYATNLPVLLPKLGVDRLILTGLAADICVLFTAADAHMRDYRLWIPEDGVASLSDERRKAALEIMATGMSAETAPTTRMSAVDWIRQLGARRGES